MRSQLPGVVHVSNDMNGGVGSVVRDLAAYQATNRVCSSVTVIAPGSFCLSNLTDKVRTVEPVKRIAPGSNMLFGVRRSNPKEAAACPVVTHFHNLSSMGCLSRIPDNCLCTLHGIGVLDKPTLIEKALIRHALRKRALFTAVDPVTADYFSKLGGVEISVVPNGLPDVPLKIAKRSNRISVGFVGCLDELKGYRYLLHAAKTVCSMRDDVDFDFVGSSSTDETRYFADYCRENQLKGRVKYRGKVDNAGIEIMTSYDMLVLPSRTEGLPMVLLEGLRAGLPILATRVGGIPGIVQEGFNGFFVERDSQDIANKIIRLCENDELRKDYAINSRKLFKSQYQLNQIASQYQELYLELLER